MDSLNAAGAGGALGKSTYRTGLTSMMITEKRVLSEKDVVVQELENAPYLEKPISATAQVLGGKGRGKAS